MNKPVSKVEWFDTYGYKFEFTGMQLAQLTYIPKLTDKGFEKFKVPEKIFKDVLDAYNVEKQNFVTTFFAFYWDVLPIGLIYMFHYRRLVRRTHYL